MTNDNISYLREQLQSEKQRIARLNELLKESEVQEFMKLYGLSDQKEFTLDEWAFISKLLANYNIEESNGIYVCTGAYYTDCEICYQDTSYYTEPCAFDCNYAEFKLYRDIETGRKTKAYTSLNYVSYGRLKSAVLTGDFERKNIVLNPFDTHKNDNGYDQVRKDFFTTALEKGENEARKLVLKKYNRI